MARPGFWANHLLGFGGIGSGGVYPAPEWFGDDGADTDALSELLLDADRWPVFRIPAAAGPGAVVIYRNMVGDYGTDYLLTHPGRSHAHRIACWDGDFTGTGLTWPELVRIADNPAPAADGVRDPAARLLLVLPLLADPEVPTQAPTRLSAALTAVGAPRATAPRTAEYLLTHLATRR
ncbi:hypothetical protein [Embleya sp. NPDC005575]|uniref:hypothetical protein n=1 Tax=Embleya sp. NPDC005575 TaxID=3156892 RepID=UPI0033B69011